MPGDMRQAPQQKVAMEKLRLRQTLQKLSNKVLTEILRMRLTCARDFLRGLAHTQCLRRDAHGRYEVAQVRRIRNVSAGTLLLFMQV